MEQRINRKIVVFSIIIGAFFIFQSCSGKSSSPKAASPKASQTTTQPAKDVKEEAQLDEKVYEYNKKGKRDPFVPLLSKAKEVSIKAQSPLENYDVRAIKILGIVQSDKLHMAEAMLPDGKAYTLKEGMTIGIYGGKISKITKDSVVVNEQVKDFRGQLKTKETILKLREEEE